MMYDIALDADFYMRPTLQVAQDLLGQILVRRYNQSFVSGMINETEAYVGTDDTACHASKGRTPRNSVMFGPPGFSYVYLVYGMHNMLNVVTEETGNPCAVLIRSIIPVSGLEIMQRLRKYPAKNLSDGPARVCQALAIDRSLNGHNITEPNQLWIAHGNHIAPGSISSGPRIGIHYADAEDRNAPWRFWIKKSTLSKCGL
ncbi:DNA-3-methyladenine glycosylase [candidate division KSB1 bacterium]|nr:DNA-3-methyladenine glycosylase [candidate division KSB1 bacterium]